MPRSHSTRRPRVALLTLGCAKNVVDSEQIASLLERAGVDVCHAVGGSDAVVVNTCGFIDPAKEESIGVVLEAAALKCPDGPRALIVTGCLSERYGQELTGLLPEADALVGTDPAAAAQAVLRALGLPAPPLPSAGVPRSRRLTPAAWSYLRISHGCDNRCAYCAIPIIRGPLRSLPRDELVAEARYLVDQGVRELNVIAQDTAAYGVDLGGEPTVHLLLRDLCSIEALRWVRLLYAHPAHVYDDLIAVLADEEKVCPYVDLPLQHASDAVLARMGRKTTRAGIERLVGTLRERIPGLTLRTTFLTGFPGETDADFEELLQFVRDMRFDRVGCFPYSPEEGTPAMRLPNRVAPELARERCDAVMAAQQPIAFEWAAGRVGTRELVLMEEGAPSEDGLLPARSRAEAPDVDPLVFVEAESAPPPGTFVDVEFTGSDGYDCTARVRGGD
jgi:ribosomal protein S12 methylthiotransferase